MLIDKRRPDGLILGPWYRGLSLVLRLGSPNGKCAKFHTVASSNNRDNAPQSLYYCLFLPYIYIYGLFFIYISFVVNHTFNAMTTKRLQQHHLLFTTNRSNRMFFCEGVTWHNLHLLITASFCCNRKAQVASVQSFMLWQQATLDIMRCNHSYIACSCHVCMGVILHAQPVCGESHIQCNANGEFATLVWDATFVDTFAWGYYKDSARQASFVATKPEAAKC